MCVGMDGRKEESSGAAETPARPTLPQPFSLVPCEWTASGSLQLTYLQPPLLWRGHQHDVKSILGVCDRRLLLGERRVELLG
jgi:hypothetical protein